VWLNRYEDWNLRHPVRCGLSVGIPFAAILVILDVFILRPDHPVIAFDVAVGAVTGLGQFGAAKNRARRLGRLGPLPDLDGWRGRRSD
jgi:hypothetical protein